MIWIPITLAAALLQTVRNAAQRSLTGALSGLGATYTRFLFGFPFALLYAVAVFAITGAPLPRPGLTFLVWIAIAGVAQIFGTAFLLRLFQLRNFSTGIVLSKTEILLTAVFGLVFLGDHLTIYTTLAILVATFGLVVLSHDDKAASWHASLRALAGPPALFGLGTGACFAIGSVGYRAASLSLEPLNFVQSAAATLAAALFLQTVLMTIYLKVREPGQVRAVLVIWRRSMVPGLAGGAASACWFTAMTIEIAAYVRMVGLSEIVFGYVMSVLGFREKLNAREVFGSLVLTAAILLLLADRAKLL